MKLLLNLTLSVEIIIFPYLALETEIHLLFFSVNFRGYHLHICSLFNGLYNQHGTNEPSIVLWAFHILPSMYPLCNLVRSLVVLALHLVESPFSVFS